MIQGGLFQSLLLRAFLPSDEIDSSSDGLVPCGVMVERLNAELGQASALGFKRFKQTSFLAGDVAENDAKIDDINAPRRPIQFPVWPSDAVPMQEVQEILKEISASCASDLPGDEAMRDGVVALLPFSKSAMKPYPTDGITDEQVAAKPADYPIRAVIQRASKELRSRAKDDGLRLISSISAAELNAPKSQAKTNLNRLQRAPARRLQMLEEILADFDKAAELRSKEKSPRWQAQFDLFRARMMTQYARIYEYNSVIGLVRKDALPDLDPKNGDLGWLLVFQDSLQSGSDAKESAQLSVKALCKNHSRSP